MVSYLCRSIGDEQLPLRSSSRTGPSEASLPSPALWKLVLLQYCLDIDSLQQRHTFSELGFEGTETGELTKLPGLTLTGEVAASAVWPRELAVTLL